MIDIVLTCVGNFVDVCRARVGLGTSIGLVPDSVYQVHLNSVQADASFG